ncbi:MAG TPA: glycine cleavage system protein GcvH [Candidatus Bathyarchaeia archaeon]|nr:glycine cleavage system protein GcvH [Candidatus Bathyarchaeia archaeon]
MNIDKNARYMKSHEWAKKEDDLFVIGITDYAQSLLKDIVYVELPTEGTTFQRGDKAADIESVKAVEELKSPLSGEVVEVNTVLEDSAESINEDPYGNGWFIKIKPSNPSEFNEMLTPEAYEKYLETIEH